MARKSENREAARKFRGAGAVKTSEEKAATQVLVELSVVDMDLALWVGEGL